jgi:type I restriction enzyme S subunit
MNKKVKLSEIVKIAGRVGWKGYTVDDLREEGPWVIGANDITTDNRLDLSKAKHISREKYEESPEIKIELNDILIVKVGSTIGKVAIVYRDIGEACINPNCVILKNCKINSSYLYYFLISSAGQAFLRNNSSASAQSALNQLTLKEMLIDLVDEQSQENISSLLNNLNSKIELNNRINTELEDMAKTLSDYWFVQFDFPNAKGKPYKTSGGKMIWNEELKREIPEGWEVLNLEKVESNIVTGKTPSTTNESYFNGDVPFICIGDVRGNMHIIETEITLSQAGAESQKNKFIPKGAICVTCIASPGLVGFATRDSQTNQQLNSIVCKNLENRYYLYFYLTDYFKYAKAKTGNTFANMNKGDFSSIKVIKPKEEILKMFSNTLDSSIDKILCNTVENQKLTNLRDWLLPMLMNGQVKVN